MLYRVFLQATQDLCTLLLSLSPGRPSSGSRPRAGRARPQLPVSIDRLAAPSDTYQVVMESVYVTM